MAWLPKLRVATASAASSAVNPLRRWIRDIGSAAALELDYDYDYYDYERAPLDRRLPQQKLDVDGSVPEREVQWVLIGEPGVKRHSYAERLSKLLGIPHISMGSLIRQELDPYSSLYKQVPSVTVGFGVQKIAKKFGDSLVVNAVNEGKLVPEDVVFALLSKRLEEGENGFILDGIPRTRLQAEILDQIVDIDLVVNFKCSEEYMLKMSSESELLHIGNSKGVESSLKKKLRVYSEQAKSVEDYYSKQKKLLNFQLAGAAGDAWQGLLAALHLQYSPINALSSSPKLTA
ncbi:hypothetical protein Gohar_020423 [Gossypium harknessii]|uniref:adenylate kinase n=1 Tax=Gossypium harknessii TaxID=34285 RepID=A0A7J9I0B5_9ROSI|nr:hypothetical protein [Gossypium harknessii]